MAVPGVMTRDDFAADDLFAGAGLLHLFADGDFEAGADEAGDVNFRRRGRDAAHGHGLARFAVAGGEGDLQFARGDDGVFVEEFVEIAQAEEQQGVRVALLDRMILLHQRGGGFGHSFARARQGIILTSMHDSGKEVEVKLRVGDLAAARRALAKLGARPVAARSVKSRPGQAGRVNEFNTLFDTPEGGLAKHGQLLRIRQEWRGGRGSEKAKPARTVFTYKGPSVADSAASAALGRRYKIRDEFEVEVADASGLRQILEALGLRGWFRYEKYRTTFALPPKNRWAAGLRIELDETPIGPYLELEGPPEAIDRAAEQLGYRHGDYITTSYLALYLEQCRRRGQPTGDMLFPKPEPARKSKKSGA